MYCLRRPRDTASSFTGMLSHRASEFGTASVGLNAAQPLPETAPVGITTTLASEYDGMKRRRIYSRYSSR